MDKIIFRFGLLVFFISLVIFSQKGYSPEDVILKAFILFFAVTILIVILAILFVRAINKTSLEKASKLGQQNYMSANETEE